MLMHSDQVTLPKDTGVTCDTAGMLISARAAQFHRILTNCEFTDSRCGLLDPEAGVLKAMQILRTTRERGTRIHLIGNGGSAGIASHVATDFVNVAQLRAYTLHDSSIFTCMANDYGYENAFARMLSQLATRHDVLIAISSSGRSANICNAAQTVKDMGGTVITLSGFDSANRLRRMGDINVWLDSRDYGFVEIGHQFVLHNIADRFGLENKDDRCL
ncbi:MAG: SIS domain-containing protein [Acidobacteriaceae bacterium]